MSGNKQIPVHKIVAKNWVHTDIIRLKDSENHRGVFIDLFNVFGFMPRFISVTKVQGQNNRFIVSAEKTPEILEYEAMQLKKIEEQHDNSTDLKQDGGSTPKKAKLETE